MPKPRQTEDEREDFHFPYDLEDTYVHDEPPIRDIDYKELEHRSSGYNSNRGGGENDLTAILAVAFIIWGLVTHC